MTPACQFFCAGYRDLAVYSELPVMESWYRTELPKIDLVTENLISCPAKGQPSQFLVSAAPCRMLAWGKSLLNVKSCVSPTGPDHSKNRETVSSDHCHQTGPVSGGRRDRNVCQTSKCPECGTHLPVGSRLTSFRDLGSFGGGGGGGGGGLDPR